MSLVEVAIAHQNPIAVFETAPVAVDIVDQNTILVENTPVVGVVQYIAIKGDPGEDGHTPDWANPVDVADLVEALSGQITATQLHSDLLAPIQKIDVGPTSLEARAALLEYADSLLNTSIAENADRITASEAAITTIDGQLLEFGVDMQTLDGRVTGNSAAIDSISTRVTANEADLYTQAQNIQGISSRVDIVETDQTAQAAIINQNTTAITVLDGDITSTAETLATITAGVDGMDAAIQIKNQVIAGTTTPLFAQHTVKIDVNGKISGFGLSSTGDSSIFEILADRFAVTNGLNNGIIPFIVDGANVYIQNGFIRNLTSDNIAAYAIKATNIDAESVRAVILTADSITANMYHELRQTFTFTGADSLDASYPFELPFKIPSETTSVVEIRVSLRVQPWRSYELTVPAGGGSTSAPGGAGNFTTTGTPNLWSATGNVVTPLPAISTSTSFNQYQTVQSTTVSGNTGQQSFNGDPHTHPVSISHTHNIGNITSNGTLADHTHSLSGTIWSNHTHSLDIANHSHTIPDHIHTLQHGIFEDGTGASVYIQVLTGGGWVSVSGPHTVEAMDVDITSYIAGTGVGWKFVRITASDRCRASVIIECKVDISA